MHSKRRSRAKGRVTQPNWDCSKSPRSRSATAQISLAVEEKLDGIWVVGVSGRGAVRPILKVNETLGRSGFAHRDSRSAWDHRDLPDIVIPERVTPMGPQAMTLGRVPFVLNYLPNPEFDG